MRLTGQIIADQALEVSLNCARCRRLTVKSGWGTALVAKGLGDVDLVAAFHAGKLTCSACGSPAGYMQVCRIEPSSLQSHTLAEWWAGAGVQNAKGPPA